MVQVHCIHIFCHIMLPQPPAVVLTASLWVKLMTQRAETKAVPVMLTSQGLQSLLRGDYHESGRWGRMYYLNCTHLKKGFTIYFTLSLLSSWTNVKLTYRLHVGLATMPQRLQERMISLHDVSTIYSAICLVLGKKPSPSGP